MTKEEEIELAWQQHEAPPAPIVKPVVVPVVLSPEELQAKALVKEEAVFHRRLLVQGIKYAQRARTLNLKRHRK